MFGTFPRDWDSKDFCMIFGVCSCHAHHKLESTQKVISNFCCVVPVTIPDFWRTS